jgi:hypothetical protein
MAATQLTIDAGGDSCKHKRQEEVEAKQCEWWCLLAAVQMIKKSDVWKKAQGKQVLRQRVDQRLQGAGITAGGNIEVAGDGTEKCETEGRATWLTSTFSVVPHA